MLTFCIVLAISLAPLNALQCYTCSYLLGYSDTSCLMNASAVRAQNCSKKYCITVRQEAISNSNKVYSFLRDCQDKPIKLNAVDTDATFRTYYRSCQDNLCNGHNGRISNSSGTGAAAAAGGNHNAIIPGKNGCLRRTRIDGLCLLLLLAAGSLLGNAN